MAPTYHFRLDVHTFARYCMFLFLFCQPSDIGNAASTSWLLFLSDLFIQYTHWTEFNFVKKKILRISIYNFRTTCFSLWFIELCYPRSSIDNQVVGSFWIKEVKFLTESAIVPYDTGLSLSWSVLYILIEYLPRISTGKASTDLYRSLTFDIEDSSHVKFVLNFLF